MKEKNLTRISLEEARKNKGETDWDKVRTHGDYKGPQEFEVDWSRTELVTREAKKLISLRVDPDILEFFKSEGKGYQTRINSVLRAYMKAMKRA